MIDSEHKPTGRPWRLGRSENLRGVIIVIWSYVLRASWVSLTVFLLMFIASRAHPRPAARFARQSISLCFFEHITRLASLSGRSCKIIRHCRSGVASLVFWVSLSFSVRSCTTYQDETDGSLLYFEQFHEKCKTRHNSDPLQRTLLIFDVFFHFFRVESEFGIRMANIEKCKIRWSRVLVQTI